MRLRHPDGTAVHVAYNAGVRTARDVDGVVGLLAGHAEPVREHLEVDRLGLGLWLAADVVTGLIDNPPALRRLRIELGTRGLDVITLNACPYDRAPNPPDWTDPRRLNYTLACARLLTDLMPDNVVRGSVSTLPLARHTPWTPTQAAAARQALNNLADGLAELHWSTGRRVRVGLVPEPGYVIETAEQAVASLSTVDNEWIGVSLDTQHQAATSEPPAAAVERLAAAYVPIVKVQVTCADPTLLAALFDPSGAQTDHVEVPIPAELAWTRDQLVALGLKEEEPA